MKLWYHPESDSLFRAEEPSEDGMSVDVTDDPVYEKRYMEEFLVDRMVEKIGDHIMNQSAGTPILPKLIVLCKVCAGAGYVLTRNGEDTKECPRCEGTGKER